MNTMLMQFLQANDLDEAALLAGQLGSLSADDEQAIRAVLAAWDDRQAVANLLLHPDVIPSDVRLAALRRGMAEPRTYLTLAAVVGLQGHADWWSDAERADLYQQLFGVIAEGRMALAERASVTLIDYASTARVDDLLLLLHHPGRVVPHNVLLLLVRLLGIDATRARLISPPLDEQRRDELLELLAARSVQSGTPLLSYIPNLSNF